MPPRPWRGWLSWLSYLGSGWRPLAWLGVTMVCAAICLGVCTVTLWTPYPVRPATETGGEMAAEPGWAGPARGRNRGRSRPRMRSRSPTR